MFRQLTSEKAHGVNSGSKRALIWRKLELSISSGSGDMNFQAVWSEKLRWRQTVTLKCREKGSSRRQWRNSKKFDGKKSRGAATLQELKQNDEVHFSSRFLNLFITQTSFPQAIMSSIQDLKSWLSKNETRKVRFRPQTLKTTGPMKWAPKRAF